MQNQPMSNDPAPAHGQHPKHRLSFGVKFMRIEVFTVLLGAALLLAAVALYAGLASPGTESKQINTKEYQAVFLANGQLYFGKIGDLNSKYLVLRNVFYIENPSGTSSTTQTQSASYTLHKLGTTELYQPEDAMVVNRDTVTYWVNMKDSSQVVTKINEYYKNPNAGQSTSTPKSTTTGQ